MPYCNARAAARYVLLAVDGSPPAERAARHVVALHAAGMAVRALIVNVQPPWAPARRSDAPGEGRRSHGKAAAEATARPRELLEAAGIDCERYMLVGEPAESIVALARARGCTDIVMGMRALSPLASSIAGSLSAKVLESADVPVTLVKQGELR